MKIPIVLFMLASLAHSDSLQIVSRVDIHAKKVALTFDAGADRGYAPQILQTLERNHVRATFGMTGRWALENKDLIRRMARDGDAFMNHTFDHRSFTGLSTRTAALSTPQRTWEILQTERLIRSLAGKSARPYFRPPYGDYDASTQTILTRLGYRYMVMWTVDSLGWNHLPASAILQRCLAALAPGAIILMHVGIQSQDALALQSLISTTRRKGYTFETVPALLSKR
ncbi:MAG: hypothetical protein NVS2B16_04200 [Chloroflexota bacterium]